MGQVVALVLQVPDPLVLLGGVGERFDQVLELPGSDRDAVGRLLEQVVEEPFAAGSPGRPRRHAYRPP